MTTIAAVRFVLKSPSVLLQTGDVITWLQARTEEGSVCRGTSQSGTENTECRKRNLTCVGNLAP